MTTRGAPFYASAMARKKAESKRSKPAGGHSALAETIAGKWGGSSANIALDRMVSELGDVPRYDIVAALKELEKAGAGEFSVGHAGRKSSFTWRKAATGASKAGKQAPPPRQPAAPPRPSAVDAARLPTAASRAASFGAPAKRRDAAPLEHVFHLRPGFLATLRLPQDVTPLEIERFCQFLQAIPFARDGAVSGE